MKVLSESLFGKMDKNYTKRIFKHHNSKNINNWNFLIVDDKDGYLGMYPLSYGGHITVYEPNKKFLYGGLTEVPIKVGDEGDYKVKKINILGFRDRLILESLEDNANLIAKNFFEITDNRKYNFVVSSRGLHLNCNSCFDMSFKINKLKNAVMEKGYIYIEYYLALEEDDFINYPSNRFLRKNEIEKYFPKEEWTILYSNVLIKNEITPLDLESKNVIIGLFYAKKIKAPIPLNMKKMPKPRTTTRLDFETYEEIVCKKNYIINGIVR